MSKFFEIYQIQTTAEESIVRDYLFMDMEWLRKKGLKVRQANYALVYKAPLADNTSLENIYFTFNCERPEDFTGHSLSMSDVVVLIDQETGTKTAYYCDRIGWKDVSKDFFAKI